MDNRPSEDTSFFEGLNDFWNLVFPRTCPKCARVYADFPDFIRETTPADDAHGLAEYELDTHEKSVGLFRNCQCGSTMMILGPDRRDTSEAGERRRHIFGALLDRMTSAQVPHDLARRRLLKVLYSGNFEDLASRLLSTAQD